MTSIQIEENNWNRACRLLIEAGKDLLILFLNQSWPAPPSYHQTLDIFLQTHIGTLLRLKNKTVLHDTQMQILYPKDGSSTNTNHWDITLVTCILNNCFPYKTKSETDSLNSIRELRNQLYHNGTMTLSDNEFQNIWAEIERVLTSAAKVLLKKPDSFCLEPKLSRIKNGKLVDKEEFSKIFEDWRQYDIAVMDAIQEVNRNVLEMKAAIKRIEQYKRKETQSSEIKDQRPTQTPGPSQDQPYAAQDIQKLPVVAAIPGCSTDYPSHRKRKVSEDVSVYNPPGKRHDSTENLPKTAASKQNLVGELPSDLIDLRSGLVHYYTSRMLKSPSGVTQTSQEIDISDIYVEPHMVLVDHTAISKDTEKRKTRIAFKDVFLNEQMRAKQIYITGDAGMGKTSFCKDLLATWCGAHCPKNEAIFDTDKITIMKQFDFLFYISLRHAVKEYDIEQMILSQILMNNKACKIPSDKAADILKDILQKYSNRCLIVLDGLDEWTTTERSCHPLVSNGIPGRSPYLDCTILTTSRPWKLEHLRLMKEEIDRQVEICGVESVREFGNRLVSCYNKHLKKNSDKLFRKFMEELRKEGLEKMTETPVLLKQLICLWYNDKAFGKSKTEVYTNMVELLLMLAEQQYCHKELILKDSSILADVTIPTCFKQRGKCEKYKHLLLSLGRLAFETLFMGDRSTQLVFESTDVEMHSMSEEEVNTCLTVGLLTQSIVPDMTCQRKSLSFLHKSFHEYFAALYVSVYGSNITNLENTISSKCDSLHSLFDMEDTFLFLSGLCPALMETISKHLLTVINSDKEVLQDRCKGGHNTELIQSLLLRCCTESFNHDNGQLYLPIPDLIVSDRYKHDLSTLEQCLRRHPKELRSFSFESSSNSVGKMLGGIISFEQSLFQMQCHLNLSQYTNVNTIRVRNLNCGLASLSWNLNEQQLTHVDLSNISSTHVASSIKKATNLKLLSVRCSVKPVGVQSSVDLDLTTNHKLKHLHLESLLLRSVALSPSVECVSLVDIRLATAGGIHSLMSSLAKGYSLRSLRLQSVKCEGHTSRGECGYQIDLSQHSKLEELDMSDISPLAVKVSESTQDIRMTQIDSLTFEGMSSLMSSISKGHCLKSICLVTVKCRDSFCKYKLDVSEHNALKKVVLQDLSPGYLILNHTVSDISLTDINILTHEGMQSLMASISNGQSIEQIAFNSIKCEEHPSGEQCLHGVDLTGHNSLNSVHMKDLAPATLKLNLSVCDVTLKNIQTLQHTALLGLMSDMSQMKMLQGLNLESVKCGDHASGEDCEYNVHLADLPALRTICLREMSPVSVTVNTAICKIVMKDIYSFKHDGLCSFMSSISNGKSLIKLCLESVSCSDHTIDSDCGFELDLFRHKDLKSVLLNGISLADLTLNQAVTEVTMKHIKTFSHNALCSLLANTHSLETVHLESVKCRKHGDENECGFEINMQEQKELRSLYLLDVSPRSVMFNTSLTTLKLKNIHTLSDDGLSSLVASIGQSESLRDVIMDSVMCLESQSNQYVIDVSRHSQLSSLYLADISPASVVLNDTVYITIKNIHTLTHDSITSLMLGITKNPELQELHLGSVYCSKHGKDSVCGYQLDLSGNPLLRKVYIDGISPGSILLNECVFKMTLKNIYTLTHEALKSLMTKISHSDQAEDIHLESVKCRSHVSDFECLYEIDLAQHTTLQYLSLQNINTSIHLSVNSYVKEITIRKIPAITHVRLLHLMTRISQAHSLKKIHIESLKCKDHSSGRPCGYVLNFKGLTQLKTLHLEDVSPHCVEIGPCVENLTLINIKTLKHDALNSLMSDISIASACQTVCLESLKCGEHGNQVECGYELDLSKQTGLSVLFLEDISPTSVKLGHFIQMITLKNIQTLAHEALHTLMSSISGSHSLHLIHLVSVKCKDHVAGNACGYTIDLSEHEHLSLYLENILPDSVTVPVSACEIKLTDIHTLGHEALCSLVTGISKARTLTTLHMAAVTCRDHGNEETSRCEQKISFLGHSELTNRHLEDVTLTPV